MKYVKQSDWIELGKELLPGTLCQYCKTRPATQGAHALIYKRYLPGAKNRKVTDVRENYMPCCDECQKFSETRAGRLRAWEVLCKREGEDHMREWHKSLPLKIKEQYHG